MDHPNTTGSARTRGAPPEPGVLGRAWRCLGRFFGDRIWNADPDTLPGWKRWLFRASRVLTATVNGWQTQRLTFRAAALTYFSVLSVVPALAFAFAVLKGLGAYRIFVQGTLRPYVRDTFSDNPYMTRAFDQVLSFVGATGVSTLGVAGLLFLVYSTIGLLSNIEVALNDTWGAHQERTLLRQLTDYVTMVVIAPLLILLAVGFGSAAEASSVVLFLRETLHLGVVIDFALRFTSVAVTSIAVFVLFVVMPNTRVAPGSALLGGVIAGILWQIALALQINAQSSLARYNALYSGFAAIPIFLLWLYVSWLVVLVGALLASSHQNDRVLIQRRRLANVDEEVLERVAVAVAARVARSFVTGHPRWTAPTLATELGVPGPLVDRVVDALVVHGILARSIDVPDPGIVPARDPGETRLFDILHAMRANPAHPATAETLRESLGPGVVAAVDALQARLLSAPENLTMRELGQRAPQPQRVRDDESRPAEAARQVGDAKQTPAEA